MYVMTVELAERLTHLIISSTALHSFSSRKLQFPQDELYHNSKDQVANMKAFHKMQDKEPERLQMQHTFHSAYSASAYEMHAALVASDSNVSDVDRVDQATLHFLMENAGSYVITHRCPQPMPLRVTGEDEVDSSAAVANALCTSFVLLHKPLLWGAAAELLQDLSWSTLRSRTLHASKFGVQSNAAWWCPRKSTVPRPFATMAKTSAAWGASDAGCGALPPSSSLLVTVFPADPGAEHWAALARVVASLRATGSTAEVVILLPASCACASAMATFIEAMVGVRAEEYADAVAMAEMKVAANAHVYAVVATMLVEQIGHVATALFVPLDTAFQLDPFEAIPVPDRQVAVAMTTPMVSGIGTESFRLCMPGVVAVS